MASTHIQMTLGGPKNHKREEIFVPMGFELKKRVQIDGQTTYALVELNPDKIKILLLDEALKDTRVFPGPADYTARKTNLFGVGDE